MTEAAEHMCKTASGEMFYSPGAQLSALWWPRGVG